MAVVKYCIVRGKLEVILYKNCTKSQNVPKFFVVYWSFFFVYWLFFFVCIVKIGKKLHCMLFFKIKHARFKFKTHVINFDFYVDIYIGVI